MLFIILALAPFVLGSVPAPAIRLHIPLSRQAVPVARVKQNFAFTFAPDTFEASSGHDNLIYSAPSLPTWLAFDNASRTLTGSPGEGEVGLYTVAITASSSSGDASLSDVVTLAVSDKSGDLKLNDLIADQLIGNDSAITSAFPLAQTSPSYPGVRVPPSWSFSLGFEPTTFTAPTRVFYTATLADGSPLPDWLDFNNQTVTFDGVTPAPEQSGQVYTIALSGSDVFGYQDITEKFNITIAAHDLVAVPTVVNLTTGSFASVALDLSKMFLIDGQPAKVDEIAEIKVDTKGFDWIKWHEQNMSLGGVSPTSLDNAATTQLPITVTDTYGDVVDSTIALSFFPSYFTSNTLGPVIANISEVYELPLDRYLSNKTDHPVDIASAFEPVEASKWLTFDNNVFKGTVPSDATYDKVSVHLAAHDSITKAVSNATLTITLADDGVPTSRHHGLTTGTIAAIAAVSSIVGIMLLLCVFVLCCRRRRRKHDQRVQSEYIDGGEEYKWERADFAQDGSYSQPGTPAMNTVEKMGEPGSVQMLVGRAGHAVLDTLPDLSSGSPSGQIYPYQAKGSGRILRNPFAKNRKVITKISNPIIMPSFSNAAFQAQLAAAVDSAGIVKRGTTYEETGSGRTTSEFDESRRSGEGNGDGESGDRSYRTERTDGSGTDSQFAGNSSRASWESEPPFVWTSADTPGRMEAGNASTTGHSVDTHESTSTASRMAGSNSTPSDQPVGAIPVQRSDFRPSPPTVVRPPITGRHPGCESPSEVAISIDNIHFPTDSDIAHTEASSDHEAVVIATASRVDARRTLDSPASSTTEKAPSISSRGPSPSPVMTTHSRLVSFAKHKIVQMSGGETAMVNRNVSQTAVVHQSRSGATATSSGSGMPISHSSPKSFTSSTASTPRDNSGGDRGAAQGSPLPAAPARVVTRATQDRSPSPPSSLPSLPAIPSLPAVPSPLNQQRILLGVSEPFHFYPPLSISPSSSVTSTSTSAHSRSSKSTAAAGTTYVAVVEDDGPTTPLPSWLHFEDMELWGVPADGDRGVWDVRIVERRKGGEKVVGRFALEVSERETPCIGQGLPVQARQR